MRMLDLFAGRLGWTKAFLALGWDVTAIDLTEPPEIPQGVEFVKCDVLQLGAMRGRIGVKAQIFGFLHSWAPDFICASSPCEEFAVHGMKHFHPNPPYPELGIKLFNHTRDICEASGVPYVMENVRAAQQFVGTAVHRCGSFYLWGNAVPPLLAQGIIKGMTHDPGNKERYRRSRGKDPFRNKSKLVRARLAAVIPPELSHCVAEYAERICTSQVSGCS